MKCDCNCHVYRLSKDSTGECCECKVGDPIDKLRAELTRLTAYVDTLISQAREMERQTGALNLQVDQMRRVVEAAKVWRHEENADMSKWYALCDAVDALTLKPKGAEGVCPLCYSNYNDPAGKCPNHIEKRVEDSPTCGMEYTVGINSYSTCTRMQGHSGSCGKHTISGENYNDLGEETDKD